MLPAVTEFSRDLAQSAGLKKALAGDIDRSYEETLLRKVSSLASALYEKSEALSSALDREQPADMEQAAHYCHDEILRLMDEARVVADQLEAMVGSKYWPYPTYGEMVVQHKGIESPAALPVFSAPRDLYFAETKPALCASKS